MFLHKVLLVVSVSFSLTQMKWAKDPVTKDWATSWKGAAVQNFPCCLFFFCFLILFPFPHLNLTTGCFEERKKTPMLLTGWVVNLHRYLLQNIFPLFIWWHIDLISLCPNKFCVKTVSFRSLNFLESSCDRWTTTPMVQNTEFDVKELQFLWPMWFNLQAELESSQRVKRLMFPSKQQKPTCQVLHSSM